MGYVLYIKCLNGSYVKLPCEDLEEAVYLVEALKIDVKYKIIFTPDKN